MPVSFSMAKKMLRLVQNGKMFYVPTLEDYNVCSEIGVPLTKIDINMLPLFKARCKKHKVEVKVYPFSVVEEHKHKKIKKRWEHGFEVEGNSIQIEIPKNKKLYENAQSLVDALKGFYGRNLYEVEVTSRKFASKIRFTLEKSFNDSLEPGWK